MTNELVKKQTTKPDSERLRGDRLFYWGMLAWPIIQFLIFYLYVNIDGFVIAFQKYVGKASASEREKIWNDFLNNYFKKGNSYINAMNRSAEELNIAH